MRRFAPFRAPGGEPLLFATAKQNSFPASQAFEEKQSRKAVELDDVQLRLAEVEAKLEEALSGT